MPNPLTPEQRIEAALLGALLIDPDTAPRVVLVLAPSDFTRQSFRTIYEAIEHVVDRGDACDYLTVTAEMAARCTIDAVGYSTVTGIINRCPTSLHVDTYARRVREAAARRRRELEPQNRGVIAL